MPRITQRKGDIAQARAIATFTEMGFDVSLPITESAEYDLIVDDQVGLWRVQAKYCSGDWVDMRKIHSNSKGYVVKQYSDQSWDWLYVYSPTRGEYLLKEFRTKGYWLKDKDKFSAMPASMV